MNTQIGNYDHREGSRNTPTRIMDYVVLIFVMLSIPVRFFAWVFLFFFYYDFNVPLCTYIFRRLVCTVTNDLSLTQLRILVPVKPMRVDLDSWESTAARLGLNEFNSMIEGEDFSARWIHLSPSRTEDSPIIVFLHGGGYALKMVTPQISYITFLASKLAPLGASVVALDYTVTPFGQFPLQLRELAALYSEVSRLSSKVILLGESAGGHLAIGLLQHLAHPVNEVEPCFGTPMPFGVGLVSPWVTLNSKGGSFERNAPHDIILPNTLDAMAKQFCKSCELESPVINPLNQQDRSYWKNLMPERSFAVWGELEVIRDAISEFAELADISLRFEEELGVHDCVLNGTKTDSTSFIVNVLTNWIDPDLIA